MILNEDIQFMRLSTTVSGKFFSLLSKKTESECMRGGGGGGGGGGGDLDL